MRTDMCTDCSLEKILIPLTSFIKTGGHPLSDDRSTKSSLELQLRSSRPGARLQARIVVNAMKTRQELRSHPDLRICSFPKVHGLYSTFTSHTCTHGCQ